MKQSSPSAPAAARQPHKRRRHGQKQRTWHRRWPQLVEGAGKRSSSSSSSSSRRQQGRRQRMSRRHPADALRVAAAPINGRLHAACTLVAFKLAGTSYNLSQLPEGMVQGGLSSSGTVMA